MHICLLFELTALNCRPLFCRNNDDANDLRFGVHEDMLYALNKPPVDGAQWTGIVTQIAINMLESKAVDAVVCVQNSETDRFSPKPVRKADGLINNPMLVPGSPCLFGTYNVHQRCLPLR